MVVWRSWPSGLGTRLWFLSTAVRSRSNALNFKLNSMKKILFILISSILMISCTTANSIGIKPKWYQNDSRIEVVNETTVIFKDVDKIEIKSNNVGLVTYVYDLINYKPVKAVKGSFSVELPKGRYLVQSNKPITRTAYEVIIE